MNENTDLLQPRSASSGDGDTHGSIGEPVAPMPHLALALSLRFVLILLMGVCLHLAGNRFCGPTLASSPPMSLPSLHWLTL